MYWYTHDAVDISIAPCPCVPGVVAATSQMYTAWDVEAMRFIMDI